MLRECLVVRDGNSEASGIGRVGYRVGTAAPGKRRGTAPGRILRSDVVSAEWGPRRPNAGMSSASTRTRTLE